MMKFIENIRWRWHVWTHDYHLIKTDLEPHAYHDYDTRLIHGAFKLLTEYVEEAGGIDGFVGSEGDEKWSFDAYVWWTHDRPKMIKEAEDDEEVGLYTSASKKRQEVYQTDKKHLTEIVSNIEKFWF